MSAPDRAEAGGQRPLPLDGRPGESLRLAWPLFSRWANWNEVRMGGGTTLAMRWRHRRSTDVDLAMDNAEFKRMRERHGADMSATLKALKDQGRIKKYNHSRHLIDAWFPTGPVSLVGSILQGQDIVSNESEAETGVRLVRTEEILFSKLNGRVVGRGRLMVRDGYDLASAIEFDPEALAKATLRLDGDEWAALNKAMAGVAAQRRRIVMGRPLVNPHDPHLARDPWRRFSAWVLSGRPSPSPPHPDDARPGKPQRVGGPGP